MSSPACSGEHESRSPSLFPAPIHRGWHRDARHTQYSHCPSSVFTPTKDITAQRSRTETTCTCQSIATLPAAESAADLGIALFHERSACRRISGRVRPDRSPTTGRATGAACSPCPVGRPSSRQQSRLPALRRRAFLPSAMSPGAAAVSGSAVPVGAEERRRRRVRPGVAPAQRGAGAGYVVTLAICGSASRRRYPALRLKSVSHKISGHRRGGLVDS